MKKYLIGLAILAVAFVSFAFTYSKNTRVNVSSSWYEYRGPVQQDEASVTNENNYYLVSAPSGCNSNENICAIFVPGTGQHPQQFDASTELDLEQALTYKNPEIGYIEMKQ